MSEREQPTPDDWTKQVGSLFSADESTRQPAKRAGNSQIHPVTIVPAQRAETSRNDGGFQIDAPDASTLKGVVALWKNNRMHRKAVLRAIELHYEGQLDVLAHSIKKAVVERKAGIDAQTQIFLTELNQQYLETMTQLDIRNMVARQDAIRQATEATMRKVNELKESKGDWPEEVIQMTIKSYFELLRRVVARNMQELGRED